MHVGRIVFSQLMDHLPPHEFHKCVERYRGDYKFRGFSCLDQFLCLAFAQLTYRESLRDIEACLRSVESKLYHMGFRGRVSKSTLADANEVHVGGGEKVYQFGGREGARCGVTLWPAVGTENGEEADRFLSQAGVSSVLARGVR